MAKDYYQILGIARTASEKEIKASYRKLARQYHPDVNPNDKSAEGKFKEISEAFQVLSDPEKRPLYDQFGENFDKIPPGYASQGPQGGQSYGAPGGVPGGMPNFDEIFRQAAASQGGNPRVDFRGGAPDQANIGDLFGEVFGLKGNRGQGFGFGRKRGPQKGADVENKLDISLAESVHGTQRRVDLAIEKPGGSGTERRNFTVRIPAGISEGSTIKVAAQGASGDNGGPRGDVFLRIHIQPDKFWKREGLDIRTEVPVTFAEAALGAQIKVPTLTGEVTLKLPAGTQSGQAIRLSGRGVKNEKTGKVGDQYVIAKIATPRQLTPREEELIKELAALRDEEVRAALPHGL